MKHVICVPEQMVIDGNFPTVVSPTRRTRRASIWLWIWPRRRGGLYPRLRPRRRPGGHHGAHLRRGVQGAHRQPDRRAAAGLPDRGKAAHRQDARQPRGPQDHRYHRDGPQGGRDQRPEVLRHLYRLQVPGGEEGQAGERRGGQGDLRLRGELRLHAGRLCPRQGRRHRRPVPHRDGGLVRRTGHDPVRRPAGLL